MRVISGIYGGRLLHEPHGHRTHPMSEKIRGALFNTLGDIEGLTVLDPFSGTGAIAIEAVSRGASSVMAVELDKSAYKTVVLNITDLQLERKIAALRANAKTWSNANTSKLFDIVIADPPFNQVSDTLLQKVQRHVKPGGLFVASLPADFRPKPVEQFELLIVKSYGDAKLHFFKRKHLNR